MNHNKDTIEPILFFLFGIFLFNEFEIHSNYISLNLGKVTKKDSSYLAPDINQVLCRFLELLNSLSNQEFYFVADKKNADMIRLYCQKTPEIFSALTN